VARKIVIDTDPGHDDAVAILLALASPELEVLGIVAVASNVPLALTQVNARKLVELSGRSVPVYAGSDRPLVRPLTTAEDVHGGTGLDGVELPDPTVPLQPMHGVDFIVDTLRREPPGTVTLCALGALTDIAAAFHRAPDIVERVAELVIMGGAYFEVGNISPAAEFNIYVDPEAASQVFASGVRLVVMPLDVSHKAITTPARVQALRNAGRVGPAVAAWMEFFERFHRFRYDWPGAALHDPTVIAYLLQPDLFQGREINVMIETRGEFTAGMTVADWWGVTDRKPNCLFMGGIDADRYFALIAERIARL
jgi:purine nucleosidase